jgi:O-acetylserine/cysteine efflux transporter
MAAPGRDRLVMGVLHFGFSFWGLQLAGNLASPAIVMQSYVPMAALLAWFALGERFGWRTGGGHRR